jgi:hypothetical protein
MAGSIRDAPVFGRRRGDILPRLFLPLVSPVCAQMVPNTTVIEVTEQEVFGPTWRESGTACRRQCRLRLDILTEMEVTGTVVDDWMRWMMSHIFSARRLGFWKGVSACNTYCLLFTRCFAQGFPAVTAGKATMLRIDVPQK